MNEGLKNSVSIYDSIQELEHDHLGRSQFAKRILNRISAPGCSTTVGLYGGWGMGKTSILNLMDALNEPLFYQRDTIHKSLAGVMTWLREVGLP
jgi:predicted KAP-like P-loop ATPase